MKVNVNQLLDKDIISRILFPRKDKRQDSVIECTQDDATFMSNLLKKYEETLVNYASLM